jgi:hypothetical protein
MKAKKRHQVNRRAFMRGAAGITLGLPFLEGLQERSAWAQDATPVFSFFIMAQNGVIQEQFWPTQTGALSASTMAGRAVAPLADHVSDLLLVNGISAPGGSPGDCGHAQGCVQAITGIAPGSGGNSSTSGGPSADVVLAEALNQSNVDGLNLYAGSQSGAFIAERMSFTAAQTPARPAQLNPYETYRRLVGVGSTDDAMAPVGAGGGSADPNTVDELLLRKKSVNDQVLDEFNHLMSLPQLSAEDRRRLENHMAGIRQLENNLMDTGNVINEINDGTGEFYGCNISPSTLTALDAFRNGVQFNSASHMIEDIVALHGETVALTFACGANRTAALQWGNGTDGTVYNTSATGGYNTFHKISHQTNSDSSSGDDSFAAAAHAEIDVIRMTTFAKVVQSFKNYGLMDHAFIMHTNSLGVGKYHTFGNLPIILAGNAGGFLKQGEYLNLSNKTNAPLLASLMTAAGLPTANFGAGGGQLTEIHA